MVFKIKCIELHGKDVKQNYASYSSDGFLKSSVKLQSK